MAVAWGSYSRVEVYSSEPSLSMPSGLASGDLLLLATASLVEMTSFPSGWTELYHRTPNDIWGQVDAYLCWRIATGLEGDQSFALNSETNFTAICIRITGASGVNPIHKYDSAELGAPDNTVAAPALTPDIKNTYGVAIGHSYYEKHDSFSGAPYSAQFYANWGSHSGNGYLAVASGAGPASGVSTGTKSFSSSTGDTIAMVAGHVLVAPPAATLISGVGFVM